MTELSKQAGISKYFHSAGCILIGDIDILMIANPSMPACIFLQKIYGLLEYASISPSGMLGNRVFRYKQSCIKSKAGFKAIHFDHRCEGWALCPRPLLRRQIN